MLAPDTPRAGRGQEPLPAAPAMLNSVAYRATRNTPPASTVSMKASTRSRRRRATGRRGGGGAGAGGGERQPCSPLPTPPGAPAPTDSDSRRNIGATASGRARDTRPDSATRPAPIQSRTERRPRDVSSGPAVVSEGLLPGESSPASGGSRESPGCPPPPRRASGGGGGAARRAHRCP